MNKRKLLRNKIIKQYDADIWGFFFKKQIRREYLFKKLGYLFFLESIRKNILKNPRKYNMRKWLWALIPRKVILPIQREYRKRYDYLARVRRRKKKIKLQLLREKRLKRLKERTKRKLEGLETDLDKIQEKRDAKAEELTLKWELSLKKKIRNNNKWLGLFWKKFNYFFKIKAPKYEINHYKRGCLHFLAFAFVKLRFYHLKSADKKIKKIHNFFYLKYNKDNSEEETLYNRKFDLVALEKLVKKNPKNVTLRKLYHYYKTIDVKNEEVFKLLKFPYFFDKTEYRLSFFFSKKLYKIFKKLQKKYILNKYYLKNNLTNNFNLNNRKLKYFMNNSIYLKKFQNIDFILKKKLKKLRDIVIYYSLSKRKREKIFTLDLIPITTLKRKKKQINSLYKTRMLKAWKLRKFYGNLTHHELKRLCFKAYKYKGDVLKKFLWLLESRIDIILYRVGIVTSIFEARQFINHKNIKVNNIIVDKRSYNLLPNDYLTLNLDQVDLKLLKKKIKNRFITHNILFQIPPYLEVNFVFFSVIFLYDILKISNISYNFKIKGKDLNWLLHYYY